MKVSTEYTDLLDSIEKKIHEVAQIEFNILDLQQVREITTEKYPDGSATSQEIKSLLASYRLMLQAEELSHDRS